MEDFKVARYAVSDSTHAAKNLAIILFNSAVIEYNEGRMKQAITCLKESALIDEDYRTLELLGDIYYKLTELQNASFYWKKALDANPAKTEISEKIERVSKEIDLAASEEKRKLAHFELRYAKTLPFDVKAAEPLLDQAYRDVGRDLGYFPAGRTVIFLYPEEEFRRLFKLPPMVRAFYDGNIRMPIPPGELKGEELARYLYHEYTHAVVSAMTNTRCPVWFSEGIAVWEEFDKKDFAQGVLKIDARGSFNLSLAALNTAFEGGAKTRDMRPYYVMAYTVVTFIVDNWGVGGLRGLLKRIASGQHIMNAIDDEFLLSEREFEERWNRYLREKYR
jgi:tetratricopeptide (TPR) repeat protein